MLKRSRNSAISTKDPSRLRKSSGRGESGIQISDDSRVSCEQSADTSRIKRVRFMDHDTIHEVSCRQDTSSSPGKINLVRSADSPKTSEYKYYKKLLGDTGRSFHSYPSDKQDKHSKKFEASNCTGEVNNMVRDKFQVSRSLSPISNVITPSDLNTPLLPAESSRNLGTHELQYMYGEIFSRKRQKLLQSAAEILSVGVDEFSSRRSDLLSEFLQRLGIKSSKSNSNTVPRSSWMELNVKSPLVASSKSSMQFEEFPRTPRLDLPSTALHHEKGLPDLWSDEANKHIHSWDSAVAPLSTGNAYETCVQLKKSQYDCVPYGGITRSLHTDRKLAIDFDPNTDCSFNRYGRATLDHIPSEIDCVASTSFPSPWHSLELSRVSNSVSSFRELKRTYDGRNEHALPREWYPFQLLGWDDVNMESERGPAIAFHGMEMTLKPDTKPPISLGDDHQLSFSSRNDAIISCSPSMFSPNFISQEVISDCCPNSKVRRYVHEEEDYPVEESDHLPLILSHAPNYLALTEDQGLNNINKWSNIFSSPPHSFHMTDTFWENIYPRLDELLLANGLDLEFGWRSLLSADFSGEHHSLTRSGLQLCEGERQKYSCMPEFLASVQQVSGQIKPCRNPDSFQ